MKTFLHIGHHKTGTTAFQRLCAAHRGVLLDNGVHYPEGPGGDGYQHGRVLTQVTGQVVRQHRASRLEDWLAVPCETMILSAESLVEASNGKGGALVQTLKAHGHVEIIYTIRNWTDYLPSRHAQYIRKGDGASWPDFLSNCAAVFGRNPNLDYGRVISEFTSGEPDAFHLRNYDREDRNKSLLTLTGIDAILEPLTSYREMRDDLTNPRFGPVRSEMQRLVNRAVNARQSVPDDRVFMNWDLATHVRRKRLAPLSAYLDISRRLLAVQAFRAEMQDILRRAPVVPEQSKRPDFDQWRNSLDEIATVHDLPRFAKNWPGPQKNFWPGPDTLLKDLSPDLRDAMMGEIDRAESSC